MLLANANPGTCCRVTAINHDHPEVLSRLYALGVFPGVKIEVLRKAPMGDPIQLKVGQTLISIRKLEAAAIQIDDLSAEAA